MKAIVLSGGGAKGAYEAGVWKALRRMHIKYDIVTGTSIGAINGMFMVQNEFHKCINMWKNINFQQLYDDFEYTNDVKEIYKKYIDKVIDGGIDTHKIDDILYASYDAYKMYNSRIAYGVVSYNFTDRKPFNATKRNTRPNRLRKYILASATCFPVFKPTKIGSDNYIDGGYYDNLPINLAIELGATEVIAVDLGAVGLKKRIKTKDIPVTYIKPRNKLEAFYMFEGTAAKKMINLGYNDTMKTYNKLEGNTYTFKKGFYNSQIKYINKIISYANKLNISNSWIKKLEKDKFNMMNLFEETIEMYDLQIDKIYNTNTLYCNIMEKINNAENIDLDEFSIDEFKKIFDKSAITKYIYTKLRNNGKINSILVNLFSKEFTMALYLIVRK